MKPRVLNYTPAATSTTGLAASVTGASFTLTNTSMGDNLAHIVTVTNLTANTHAGKTITIVGTDADGNALTETITGPAGSATVSTTNKFRTVTSVTPSATIGADTFSIGYTAVAQSQTVPIDWPSQSANIISVDITGTINYSVEEAFENVFTTATPALSVSWVVISGLSGKTADTTSSNTIGATAFRLTVASVTAGATVKISTVQPPRAA